MYKYILLTMVIFAVYLSYKEYQDKNKS